MMIINIFTTNSYLRYAHELVLIERTRTTGFWRTTRSCLFVWFVVNCKVLFTACAAALLFCGCVSLMEKAGRVVDGSVFAEKKIAHYRSQEKDAPEITEVQNKAGERSVIIAFNDFPMMKLRGSAPDENGEFYLVSLEYLGGSVHGWNEYRLDLSGSGNLTLGNAAGGTVGDTAVLEINADIEPVQISAGRIHRYDTRIVGSEALTNLRNRRERILAVTEWMASREDTPRDMDLDDFDKYYKPLLFPEMVSKKMKPEGWLREGDHFIKAEDIRWNTSYTERVFPEELRQVRNSGTLLRDWEDALSWIYLEYEWENIKETLTRRTILQRIK